MENMNKIDRTDFIDVYVINTLKEIKKDVKNNIKLDKKKEKETDKMMSFVLKDLINSNFKNLQLDVKGNLIYTMLPIVDKKENEKIRLSLMLYYTALYYDNVDLLHRLLKEDIDFRNNWSINLQYLDKSISSKFKKEKYIEMIKTCGYIFINFAKSIKNLPEEEKEKYIQRFAELINLKYDLICDILKQNKHYVQYLEYTFEKENLDIFSDETYKQATSEQLVMINNCHTQSYSQETRERLNNLMQTKVFSNYLCNFDLMMKLYTDEELATLSFDISMAINNFSQTEESLNKIIDFIQRRPDLARSIICISKERFMEFDNFTLIEVSDHTDLRFYDEDLDLLVKTIKPKLLLKKAFGAYKKKGS